MKHLLSIAVTALIYGGGLIGSRYLMGIASPRGDWRALQSWWHWTVRPFLPSLVDRLWVYLFIVSGASMHRLTGMRARLERGEYADDTGI